MGPASESGTEKQREGEGGSAGGGGGGLTAWGHTPVFLVLTLKMFSFVL